MNIFFLDTSPELAAQYQCDKHVVKLIVESAQLLSNANHILTKYGPYRLTHVNHPCTKWVAHSLGNYVWLTDHFEALLNEYTYRYDKIHACQRLLYDFRNKQPIYSNTEFTDPPLCMPDEYKVGDLVESYRTYYIKDKIRFAKWNRKRQPPNWWPVLTQKNSLVECAK